MLDSANPSLNGLDGSGGQRLDPLGERGLPRLGLRDDDALVLVVINWRHVEALVDVHAHGVWDHAHVPRPLHAPRHYTLAARAQLRQPAGLDVARRREEARHDRHVLSSSGRQHKS